jgi:hypothetical protein
MLLSPCQPKAPRMDYRKIMFKAIASAKTTMPKVAGR